MDTIKSPTEIDSLFRSGRRARRPTMIVLCSPTPVGRDTSGRTLFVAGKKMGGATTRNRSKRVLRAAVARSGRAWAGHDVALVATARTASAEPGSLDDDLVSALDELGIAR